MTHRLLHFNCLFPINKQIQKVLTQSPMYGRCVKFVWIVWLLNLLTNQIALAEGTRQVSPNTSAVSALLSAPDLNSGSFFNTSEDNRIYFNIKDAAAENLYFGFDWRTYSTTSAPAQTFMYYRIVRPDGTVALGPTLWAGTGAGKIDTYAQALAGPNISGSVPTGYTPLVFTPTVNGEHWIEIWRGTSATDPTPNTAAAGRAQSPLFDLTVANKTSPFAVQNGRVFSFKWGLVAVDPSTFFVSVLGNAAPTFGLTRMIAWLSNYNSIPVFNQSPIMFPSTATG